MRFRGFGSIWFAALVSMASVSHAVELVGKPRIIDGDTIEISGARVRLHGIDAPEVKQKCRKYEGAEYACGAMATFALAELVEEHRVKCVSSATARYGRKIATCYAGPVNLNLEMVRRGWAIVYRRYSALYSDIENQARSARRGLWQGLFTAPWDWRRGLRLRKTNSPSTLPDAEPAVPKCKIKGNISNSGERIYHLPGSRHYEKTIINTEKNERWFCSEAEAVQAGWRAAK